MGKREKVRKESMKRRNGREARGRPKNGRNPAGQRRGQTRRRSRALGAVDRGERRFPSLKERENALGVLLHARVRFRGRASALVLRATEGRDGVRGGSKAAHRPQGSRCANVPLIAETAAFCSRTPPQSPSHTRAGRCSPPPRASPGTCASPSCRCRLRHTAAPFRSCPFRTTRRSRGGVGQESHTGSSRGRWILSRRRRQRSPWGGH